MGGHVQLVSLLSNRRSHDLSLAELWLIAIQPRGGPTQSLSLHLLKIQRGQAEAVPLGEHLDISHRT